MQDYIKRRRRIQTGDIILFSGNSRISNAIKLFTLSEWSHVGMAVRVSVYGTDSLFLWESTELTNIADIETGHAKPGVQLVPLGERIRKYRGQVYVRHLSPKINAQMGAALGKLRRRFRAAPYEKSKWETFKAAYDGPFGKNTEDFSSFFCSELVAAAYQTMGLLPKTKTDMAESTPYRPANEYSPKDFSEKRKLRLLKSYKLGRELPLKPGPNSS